MFTQGFELAGIVFRICIYAKLRNINIVEELECRSHFACKVLENTSIAFLQAEIHTPFASFSILQLSRDVSS